MMRLHSRDVNKDLLTKTKNNTWTFHAASNGLTYNTAKKMQMPSTAITRSLGTA